MGDISTAAAAGRRACGGSAAARTWAGWAGPGLAVWLAGWLAVLVTGNDNDNSLRADIVNIFYF